MRCLPCALRRGAPVLIAALASALVAPVAGATASRTSIAFEHEISLFSEGTPVSVAVADVAGGPANEIVAAQQNPDAVMVYSLGGGGLHERMRLDLPARPTEVLTDDLDGDGRLEILIVLPDVRQIAVAGVVGGQLRVEHTLDTSGSPRSVVAGDLDRNGFEDVAFLTTEDSTVTFLFQDPGDVWDEVAVPAIGQAIQMVAADLDGDSWPDLAMNAERRFAVLYGAGQRRFESPAVFETGRNSETALTAMDLDDDGDLDLALMNCCYLIVLENRARGDFASRTHFSVGSNYDAFAMTSADFDLDGRVDLIVAGDGGIRSEAGESGILTPALRDGSFHFELRPSAISAGYPAQIAAGDLDGDGNPDVAMANASRGGYFPPALRPKPSISVMLNVNGRRFAAPAVYFPAPTYHMAAFRRAGSRLPDIIGVANPWGALGILQNEGDGSFCCFTPLSAENATSNLHASEAGHGGETIAEQDDPFYQTDIAGVADFDGDGMDDLVASRGQDTQEVWLQTVTGAFRRVWTASGFRFSCVVDANGDGLPDLILQTGGSVWVARNTGGGTFEWDRGPDGVGGLAAFVDMNGDGRLDVVSTIRASHPNTPPDSIVVWLSRAEGGYVRSEPVPAVSEPFPYWEYLHPRRLVARDFDHDGKPDILVFGTPGADGGAYISVLHNRGGGTLVASQAPVFFGNEPTDFVLADFDRDGWWDVAASDLNLGRGRTHLIRGAPGGGFQEVVTTGRAGPSYSILAADFNGDGRDDLAIGGNGLRLQLNESLPRGARETDPPMEIEDRYALGHAYTPGAASLPDRGLALLSEGVPIRRGEAFHATLWAPVGGLANLDVFDVAGRRLHAERIRVPAAGRVPIRIQLSGGPSPGVYLARVSLDDQIAVRRFVVLR